MLTRPNNLRNLHKLNRGDPAYRKEIRDACKNVLSAENDQEELNKIDALRRLLPNT